jgi:hypothetical protein
MIIHLIMFACVWVKLMDRVLNIINMINTCLSIFDGLGKFERGIQKHKSKTVVLGVEGVSCKKQV